MQHPMNAAPHRRSNVFSAPRLWASTTLFALACQSGFAVAQNRLPEKTAVPAVASNPTFVIQGFDITGENPLPDGEATRILAPYLRTDATMETLQKATVALEAALKERGFALHRVALPPQELGQTVNLNIVKFVIGKVTVEGNATYGEANIRASVPELKEGTSPNFRTMAVQTAIANESQSKRVQIALKESEEPDSIDARIVVKDSKPWNFAISANNTGTEATGRDRFTLSGGHTNLFDLDHQFVAAYTTSLERASDVKQLGLNYRVPVYSWGGVVGASYTQSDVVGNFGTFNSTGAGRTLGLNYSQYLPPDGGYRGYLTVGLDDKQFDVTQINGIALAGQQVRRSVPLTLGYNARMESDTSSWGYNAELALNLPSGGGNDLAAYQSEDTRIQTAQWRVLRAGVNYLATFADGWLWGVKGNLQYTTQALIAGEQFGLGGATSVRGTGERPMSGDSGALLSAELTTKELAPGLRLLGFVDAGWLGNNATAGTARLDRDSLSSVGVGLRYGSSSFMITADYAQIVGGSQQALVPNLALPRPGDQKLHINLSARF